MGARTLLITLGGLALSACASPQARAPQREVAARVAPAHAAQAARALAARASIDARGAQAECDDARQGEVLGVGLSRWARAWCGHRASRAALVLQSVEPALRYFEALGDTRRQIELHLLAALAADALDQEPARAHHASQARQLMALSGEPLVGAADDPLPGDLPYLLAHASQLGLSISPRALSAGAALRLASEEYASVSARGAQAHALRALARWEIGRGELGLAARAASEALASHPERAPLREDVLLLRDLAQARGDLASAQALDAWLTKHEAASSPERAPSALTALPEDAATLTRALRARPQQQALLTQLRALRADPARAIMPPPGLISALRDPALLESLSPGAWEVAHELGSLLAEHGYLQDARRYLQRAVEQVERVRASLPDPARRQQFFAARRDLYMELVHAHVGIETSHLTQQDYHEALRYGSALKARGLLDLLEGGEASASAPGGLSAPLPEDSAALREALRRYLAADLGPASGPSPLRALSLPALPEGVVLVEYLLGERASYVWLYDGTTVHMRRIAGARELRPLVAAFRRTLARPVYSASDFATHRAQSERLHVALFGPVQDLLVRAKRVIIAPDDLLHELPFEALARPSLEARPRYLIEDVAVSYVPSAATLATLSQRPAPSARPGAALLLGAPRLSQPSRSLSALTLAPLARPDAPLEALFPALPGSHRELSNVKTLLGDRRVDLLTGAAASEQALRARALEGYALIHLATHGLSDAPGWRAEADPMRVSQPALLLSGDPETPYDGLLRLEEILSFHTQARLVVLSGCTTGRGWNVLGDGAYGLAGAFLSTGSRAVMASTWAISDRATMALMTLFYDYLSAGRAPDEALRAAQLELLRHGVAPDRPWLPPFYWASFRIIGDAGALGVPREAQKNL